MVSTKRVVKSHLDDTLRKGTRCWVYVGTADTWTRLESYCLSCIGFTDQGPSCFHEYSWFSMHQWKSKILYLVVFWKIKINTDQVKTIWHIVYNYIDACNWVDCIYIDACNWVDFYFSSEKLWWSWYQNKDMNNAWEWESLILMAPRQYK